MSFFEGDSRDAYRKSAFSIKKLVGYRISLQCSITVTTVFLYQSSGRNRISSKDWMNLSHNISQENLYASSTDGASCVFIISVPCSMFWWCLYWIFRVEKISQDYAANVEQHKETIEHLTVKNETLAKTYKVNCCI